MVAIAGLGIAGTYLLRRMSQEGMDVAGYDPKTDGFYVPCGYATNLGKLGSLLKNIGLEPEKYLQSMATNVIISTEDGRKINMKPKGFCTIDKNLLESDIIQGLDYQKSRAPLHLEGREILIDATGVSRYYLGKPKEDFLMHTKEYLSEKSEHEDFYFRYFSAGRGYYWEFPLGNRFHIGAGAETPELVNSSLSGVSNPIRIMSRKIRLKPLFDETFRENVIGVGEAVGTVSPITGEGILPSMESAEILFQCFRKYDDPVALKENYVRSLKKEFARFEKLFQLLVDARNGTLRKIGNLSAIGAAREDFENFGIELKISSVLKQLAFR